MRSRLELQTGVAPAAGGNWSRVHGGQSAALCAAVSASAVKGCFIGERYKFECRGRFSSLFLSVTEFVTVARDGQKILPTPHLEDDVLVSSYVAKSKR